MGKTNNAKYRPESRENLVLNSAFDFWQEGINFPAIADGVYASDLIAYSKVGSMVHTASRSTDVPASATAKYSLDTIVTTVDSSIAATDRCYLQHRLEGLDLQRIKGKRFTVSFWVKATKVGTYCVSFRNGASDRSYIQEYSILSSNTWEYKEFTIQHDATGSWNYDSNLGLSISWALAMGTTFQAPSAGSWQSGNFLATANQVNATDFIGNVFRITQIKVNPGAGAGDYCRAGKSVPDELLKIQRWIQKSYSADVAPGTITGEGILSYYADSVSMTQGGQIYWSPEMRVAPSITVYNPATGASGSGRRSNATDTAFSGLAAPSNRTGRFVFAAGGTPTTMYVTWHFVASARY